MNQKIKTLFTFSKKNIVVSLLTSILVVLLVLNFTNLAKASFGTWGDSSLVNACVDSRGRAIIVTPGTSCNPNESQATWLKDINVGTGLSETRDSNGVTITSTGAQRWEADGSNMNGISPAGTWVDVPNAAITQTFSGGKVKAEFTGTIVMNHGDGTAYVRFEVRPNGGTTTDSTQSLTIEHVSSASSAEYESHPFALQALLTVPNGSATIVPQVYSNNSNWDLGDNQFILEQ